MCYVCSSIVGLVVVVIVVKGVVGRVGCLSPLLTKSKCRATLCRGEPDRVARETAVVCWFWLVGGMR